MSAREVVIATDGYTGGLDPYLRRRIIPVSSYMIGTEMLPEGLAERLSPKGRKRDLWYFRLSPDKRRVIFGERPGIFESNLRSAARRLHRAACEVWPELSDFRTAFCWTGKLAVWAHKIPHMGVHDRVHYAIGCNGRGVAMMSYLGSRMAQKISVGKTALVSGAGDGQSDDGIAEADVSRRTLRGPVAGAGG